LSNQRKNKYCPRCKLMKPIDEFYKSPSRYDGLRVYCKVCTLMISRESYYKNHESSMERQRVGRQRVKKEVLAHYSAGSLACIQCGYSDIRALSIDHIGGGGSKHKRILGRAGTAFYRWLKEQHYPEGYQVLCMNCQFVKRQEEEEHGNK